MIEQSWELEVYVLLIVEAENPDESALPSEDTILTVLLFWSDTTCDCRSSGELLVAKGVGGVWLLGFKNHFASFEPVIQVSVTKSVMGFISYLTTGEKEKIRVF